MTRKAEKWAEETWRRLLQAIDDAAATERERARIYNAALELREAQAHLPRGRWNLERPEADLHDIAGSSWAKRRCERQRNRSGE